MYIVKLIKPYYEDGNGFPLYSNMEFFIERNSELVKREFFPILQEEKYDLLQLSRFKLRMLIREQEQHIERHRRYLSLPDINLKDWKAWESMQLSILEEYNRKITSLSVESDIKDFIDLNLSLLNDRIDSFKNDLQSEHEDKDKINSILKNISEYKRFFLEYYMNIYVLCRIWDCYYVYNIEEKIESDASAIINLYSKYGFDINTDKQFSKYSLISSSNFKANPPQIYDDRLNCVVLLKNSSNEIIDLFCKLKEYIGNISFQINPDSVYTGIRCIEYCLEHLEIGKYFEISKVKNISIDKLCDETYQNVLWITKDSTNITFEEVIDDFIIDGNNIVSQVIHLEYVIENGSLFITHIDHEYIIYDIESYELRKKECKIRGSGKIKTFKIDNSKIPMIINDDNILIRILLVYFRNPSLILEYFTGKQVSA